MTTSLIMTFMISPCATSTLHKSHLCIPARERLSCGEKYVIELRDWLIHKTGNQVKKNLTTRRTDSPPIMIIHYDLVKDVHGAKRL
jgi:hypothetical protein